VVGEQVVEPSFQASSPAEIRSSFSSSPAVKPYSTSLEKKLSRNAVTIRPRSSGISARFSSRT
jgi:hypothetical protein